MRTLLLVLCTISIVSLNAQDWLPINTIEGNILNLFYNIENPYYSMAGTDEGLYIEPEAQEVFLQTNLPVLGFAPLDDTHCLFIMGDGSWSDGIYKLDMETQQYDVVVYTPWPHFLYKHPNGGTYFAGGDYGLYTSDDGINWTEPSGNEGPRYDIAIWQDHIAIACGQSVMHSPDNGETWNTHTASQIFTNITYDPSGTLYGVFGSTSNSSGLWSSPNHGMDWTVEFYSMNLYCADWNMNGELFVGWNPPDEVPSDGIAIWHADYWDLESMNLDLPNLYINQITCHPLIDCINVIACTKDGAYMNITWPHGAEQVVDPSPMLELTNYPNPFNPETTINFSLDKPTHCELSIYNVKGQRIATLIAGQLDAGTRNVVWHGTDQSGKNVSSGVYTCRLKTDEQEVVRKLMMVK